MSSKTSSEVKAIDLLNYLVIYERVLPADVCRVLREEAEKMPLHPATIGLDNAVNEIYRNTLVSIFPEEHWIRGILFHYGAIANNIKWNYDINGPSPAQYARYDRSCHYNWHADTPEIPISALPETRKITTILNISESGSYAGGQFCIRLGTDTEDMREYVIDEIDETGTIIAFPSVLSHKVMPVASGTRSTITSWMVGQQFR